VLLIDSTFGYGAGSKVQRFNTAVQSVETSEVCTSFSNFSLLLYDNDGNTPWDPMSCILVY
jgi:hypothetical protein